MNLSDRMQHLIEDPGSPCHLGLLGPYFTKRFAFRVRFASLRLSSFLNPFDPDRGPCLALGCAPFLRVPLLASRQGIRFSPRSRTYLCSLTLDVSHRYLQARRSAEKHLADVWGTDQSGTAL